MSGPDTSGALASFFKSWACDALELAAASELPASVIEILTSLKIPIDQLIVETPAAIFLGSQKVQRRRLSKQTRNAVKNEFEHEMKGNIAFRRPIALDRMCEQLIGTNNCLPSTLSHTTRDARPLAGKQYSRYAGLGVILGAETSDTLRLLLALACKMDCRNFPVIVFGRTSIDEHLISRGVFVVGAYAAEEIARLTEQYRLGRLLLPHRRDNFWRLEKWRSAVSLPAAFFNFSHADFCGEARDLVLDCGVTDQKAVVQIDEWVTADLAKLGT